MCERSRGVPVKAGASSQPAVATGKDLKPRVQGRSMDSCDLAAPPHSVPSFSRLRVPTVSNSSRRRDLIKAVLAVVATASASRCRKAAADLEQPP